ncbi:MAG: UDP-N-acetylmuramate--L-alanine ligase [Acidobacteria bacterium]|nr:UDP-N-acetylmuramate--L-alanine ligase [Acidobacteriota bacterium]
MFLRFAGLKRVHFVGIGGAGMSGIAEVLAGYDLEVTGSDLVLSETTARLEKAGVEVFEGHDAAQVESADLVVLSSAVPADNVERLAASRLGIPLVRRAEMLGELMRMKYGIAIAGTHGKTTTTSMVGALLTETGFDPTVIVGGRLRVSGTGARLGRSEFLVAEADEYDRSFLRLQPIIAVITSIDRDHLDTYADLEEIEQAFLTFAEKVPFFGQLILCLDDENIQRLLPRLADHRVVTYGSSPQAQLRAADVEPTERGSRFRVVHAQKGDLGWLEVPMPGRHNVHNALAAVAVGLALGLDFEAVGAVLSGFAGVHRRFERLGTWNGAHVVDDYAHHPTEVAATLEAAREAYPKAVIHAVFQPHLYSRTRDLYNEFGRSLLAADRAWVTEIYASREQPIEGVTADLVVDAARRSGHRHCDLCRDWCDMPSLLEQTVQAGDLILTLGAGDVYRLAQRLTAQEAP